MTGDETVLKHFGDMKSALAGWVERECLHGYEPEAEAHHGTEPFLLFLPRYIEFVPDDQEARSMLIDAAEHIGNWVEEIPTLGTIMTVTRFAATTSGVERFTPDAETAYEVAEHFRFIHIALAAYRITGRSNVTSIGRYDTVGNVQSGLSLLNRQCPCSGIWLETAWAKRKLKREIYTG